jgi:hypothetical protein
MRSSHGGLPMEPTHTWEPSGNATRMTLPNRGGLPTISATQGRQEGLIPGWV